MAVHIPVVIDIDQAFQDAANRVGAAMKPLENQIVQTSAKIKFQVGVDENGAQWKTLTELLTVVEKKQGAVTRQTIASLQEISNAIAYCEEKLMRLYAIEQSGTPLSKKQASDLKYYQESYIALNTTLEQRQHNIKLLQQETQAAIKAKRAEEERAVVIGKTATTMSQMQAKMAALQGQLQNTDPKSPQWNALLQTIKQLEGEIAKVQQQIANFGISSSSIDGLNAKMQALQKTFNAMGYWDRWTNADTMSGKLRDLQLRYADLREAMERASSELTLEYDQRQKAAAAAAKHAQEMEKVAQAIKKSTQRQRYESAVLKMNGNSMRILSEQARILTERLNKAKFGTKQFDDLATKLQNVKQRMQEVQTAAEGTAAATTKTAASATGAKTSLDTMNTSLKRQSTLFMQLRSIAAMYFSIFGAARFVKNIRETTAELELQKVALTSIINDTDKASQLFRQIKATALKSPFEIKQLITFTKQLAAYRIETDKLFDVTTRLADVSAGLGVDMNRLVLAYGQVRAASVLRGQELRQFTEAGVPLVELLAEKFQKLGREGTTTADVFELISKRAVPFKMIEEIFNDMTSAGGVFYKMQEKQSETLKGQWMKLKDALTIMYDEMGRTEGIHKAFEDFIKISMSMARNWREVSRWVGMAVSALIAYKVAARASAVASQALTFQEALLVAKEKEKMVMMPRVLAAMVGDATAKRLNVRATMRLTAAQAHLLASTTLLEKAFWKLRVAMLSNPYGLIAAGIAAAVAGIVMLATKTKEASFSIDEFEKSATKFQDAMQRQGDIKRLVNIYEELAEKTNRTKEEQEQLTRVSRELANTFPDAIKGFNDQADAVEINIKRVKELSEVEGRLAQEAAEIEKKNAQKELEELEKRRFLIDQAFRFNNRGVVGKSTAWRISLTDEDKTELNQELDDILSKMTQIKATMESFDEILFIGPQPAKDANKTLTIWQKKVLEIQKEKAKTGAISLFTSEDLEKADSILKFSKELEQQQKEITQRIKTNNENLKTATILTKQSLEDQIKADKETLKMVEAIRIALGLTFKSSGSKSDTRLSDLKNQISELTNAYKKFKDLRDYKNTDEALLEIDKLFPQLKGWKPTEDELIKRLNEMLDDVRAKIKKSPKDKVLLDMQRALETEISNIKFDKVKKDLQAKLEKLKDDIKRSETARNFYENILGLTGDEELAASMSVSVYGGLGDDFKARMQKQLEDALKTLDADQVTDELRNAAKSLDIQPFLAQIEKFSPEYRKLLKELADDEQKFYASQMENWIKELQKAKTYGEQRVEIAKKTAQRISEIEASTLSREQKDTLIGQYRTKEAKDLAKVEYEAFKDSPVYIQMFEDLESASTKALGNMRTRIAALKEQWKDLDPTELKELQRRLDEIDEQLATRNPFKSLIGGLKEYIQLVKTSGTRAVADADLMQKESTLKVEQNRLAVVEEEYRQAKAAYDLAVRTHKIDSDEVKTARANLTAVKNKLNLQKKVTDKAKNEADVAEKLSGEYAAAAKAILNGAEKLREWSNHVSDASSGLHDILDTFGSDDLVDTFDTITEGIQQTLGGVGDLGVGLARALSGDIVGGVAEMIKGLGSVIAGTFGTAKKLKIKAINKQIEDQGKLLDDLAESYEKLEDAMSRAFGADYIYNYNQQLKNLTAQIKAAETQLALEKKKGKKADEKQIAEYEKKIRELQAELDGMSGKLSEYFTGTDLTSASSEFASAWIEAYKSFSSTTEAMKEKFDEMVQNMVTNSIGAKLVQTILGPLFDEIDAMAQEGGELSANEIAKIATEAPGYINTINNAMTNLMTQLGAAGYNIRQQASGFTGISRNIAGASEESINGLAAGINTQNFYISYMPMIYNEVMMIREHLVGAAGTEGGSEQGEGGLTYQEQVLTYMSTLPQMRDDMAAIRALLDKVIKPAGVKSSHYVSVNM